LVSAFSLRMPPDSELLRLEDSLRARIGADLHDGVGQTLTGLAALTCAHAQSLSGGARRDAERIHELVCAAAEEVRRLSHGLSPEWLRQRGLAGGLELLAESVRKDFRRGCECEIDAQACSLNETSALHLLRIAQEAVNNALRHGGAQNIRLCLRREGREVVLEVSDDGRGMDFGQLTKAEGIGVQTMRKRAAAMGASFEMQPGAEQGVHVCCRVINER
jgi:two-component system sensor kinase FixL